MPGIREKGKEMKKRPLAYITAHWSDNEYENTERAAKFCRAVYDAGFFSHLSSADPLPVSPG